MRLVNLAPTIAELSGRRARSTAPTGESLRAVPRGGVAGDERRPAYAETYFPQFFMQWAPLRAVEAGRWKYIDAPEPELYDLSADPREERNVAAAEPARNGHPQTRARGHDAARSGRLASTPLSAEARAERLASLGYLSAAAPEPASDQANACPIRSGWCRSSSELLEGNRALSRANRTQADALTIAREVLAKDPGNAFARLLLGRAALATGRNQEAVARSRPISSCVPGSADAHHWMALAHLRLGDRARALAEEEAALAHRPAAHGGALPQGGLAVLERAPRRGLADAARGLKRDPSNTSLRWNWPIC